MTDTERTTAYVRRATLQQKLRLRHSTNNRLRLGLQSDVVGSDYCSVILGVCTSAQETDAIRVQTAISYTRYRGSFS